MTATRHLSSGAFWISLSEAISASAALFTTILAARILAPDDFGTMAILFLVIGILDAFSRTGFEQALIQKKEDPHPYLDVAFTWHLGRGVLIGMILVVASPWIARFFSEPSLQPALLIAGLYPLMQGAKNPGELFFTRNLNFRKVCALNVARALMKLLVAVPAILIFQNFWALLIEFIAGALFALLISYFVHPYRPGLRWDWSKARELIRFGKWISGLTILGFFMNKGDDLFLGKYLGALSLGFYYYAFEISNWPATKITHVLSRVSFPAYSRLQDRPEELRSAFLKVMKATLLLTAPASAAIFSLIPLAVTFLLGEHWEPIIPLVQILVIAGAIRSFQALAGALFQASGRPDLDFKMNLPRALGLLILIWPLTALFGLSGAALAVVISLLLSLPIWFYGVQKLLSISLREVFRTIAPAILLAFLLLFSLQFSLSGLDFGEPSTFSALSSLLVGLTIWCVLILFFERFTPWKLAGELLALRSLDSRKNR